MTKQGAELFRLCELICLAQDAGLVLGVESPPYGLLRHGRIRPLLTVACSRPATASWGLKIFWFSVSCPPGPLL